MDAMDDAFGAAAAAAAAAPLEADNDAAAGTAAAAAGAGGNIDDAPSTSLGHHDQGAYGGGGGGSYGGAGAGTGDAGNYYDDGGDGDGAPPPSDFRLLQRALLNERLAPEILPYEGDLVARVREAVEAQEREIDRLERDPDGDIARCAYALERDRLRWLLKAYLRARLAKVQRYAALVLRDAAGVQARVSPGELRFANDYFVALGRLMQDQVLGKLPPNYSSLLRRFNGDTAQALVDEPDTDVFVFCRVTRDCGAIPDGPNGETADLRAGDLLNIRYAHVAHLVVGGAVHLV